jgi:ATP synthase protein I
MISRGSAATLCCLERFQPVFPAITENPQNRNKTAGCEISAPGILPLTAARIFLYHRTARKTRCQIRVPVKKDPFQDRLKRLEERTGAAKSARVEPARGQSEYTQSSLAWRMVTELVAGMGLGVGIGYGLDRLFGTIPLFLMLFALLGFAAGVRVMMRTAEDVRLKRSEGALLQPRTSEDDAGPGGLGGD